MDQNEWAKAVQARLARALGGAVRPLIPPYLDSLAEADRLEAGHEALLIQSLAELGSGPLPVGHGRLGIREGVAESQLLEIVHPDMPFLLASVSMALADFGIEARRVAHPVVKVKRDARGRLKSLGEAAGSSESWMQFVLQTPLDAAGRDALEKRLRETLDQVRLVTGDWYAMRQKVFAAAGRQIDPEAKIFLEWVEGGHFTLMGHGRFTLHRGRLSLSGKGLGLFTHGIGDLFDPRALATAAKRLDPFVAKAGAKSKVHRPALLDLIGVPSQDGKLDLFLGLFTADAYAAELASLPWLRRKRSAVLDHFRFDPFSHNGRLLANILETLPRDLLFEAEVPALIHLSQGVLDLQARSRVALFLLEDPFKRFVEALVYVPREGYDTRLRLSLQSLIEAAAQGRVIGQTVLVNEQPLARFHLVVTRQAGAKPIDERALEADLAKAARGWGDELAERMTVRLGEARARQLLSRYAKAFPAAYREAVSPGAAVADILRMEDLQAGAEIEAALEEEEGRLLFKLARADRMIALSDVLPRLENLGFSVLSETPFKLTVGDAQFWLHVFEVEKREVDATRVVEAFLAVWRGQAEDDGFNRLIGGARLDWRQAALLRAMARYLIQAGGPASLAYMARTLERNPTAAADLVAFFTARFEPGRKSAGLAKIRARLLAHLDAVASADEDRILRRFLNLIEACLRTSYFLNGPTMAFKFKSEAVDGLPQPRPWAEIWVHGPRVEGIHLRGGKVARGGIRWSDRPEDFRTEILGLMKAQTVKNTVIVPVGAKGGFVVRRPPALGGREALQAEGVACYRLFIQSLLDITDNLTHGKCVPARAILRLDADDPYLVVAADKGTASFSDIANEIALKNGFWLGDAFASGGSKGYDHKGMGITAKGAWISVRRHFSEMGVDPEKDPIRVVGVGDMSGDVFGNGMLRSKSMKLVAAFDHRHVFLDPDPNPGASFKERLRLFKLPRSSWADYDPRLISKGGGVYDRQAKTLRLSKEVQALLGLKAAETTPTELVRAVLRMKADLMWFGGIGTYVKASFQNNADAGDRANDPVRIDAVELQISVIGEGANLAMTQMARIEFAKKGGRVNTDAIDNSAGVDTSDHEVNIKILLDGLVAKGRLTPKGRDKLLRDMTDDVAALVLRDNVLQTMALSMAEAQGADALDGQIRLMRQLEKAGVLKRKLAGLPADEELAERQAKGQGLTRPELAELLAHTKIWLKDEVLKSDLPDAREIAPELLGCFPARLGKAFPDEIQKHPLKRELLATHIVNSLVNRLGPAFVAQMMERTGASAIDVAGSYLVVRDSFGLRSLWAEVIEAPALPDPALQAMLAEINRLVERVSGSLLLRKNKLSTGEAIHRLGEVASRLQPHLARLVDTETLKPIGERVSALVALGAPEPMARRVADLILLAALSDVTIVADVARKAPDIAAKAYFAAGARFGLGGFKRIAENLRGGNHWQRMASYAVIEELHQCQRDLAIRVLKAGGLEKWIKANEEAVKRLDALIGDVKGAEPVELAALALILRGLRAALE